MTPVARILVPTDFSETSDAALLYAEALAEKLGASLHLLHVCADPYAAGAFGPEVYGTVPPSLADEARRGVERELAARVTPERRARGTVEIAIVEGLAANRIVEYARTHDIDLIIMGTHGRGGLAHFLVGSVAEHVVRIAPCPVLTVRGVPASLARQAA